MSVSISLLFLGGDSHVRTVRHGGAVLGVRAVSVREVERFVAVGVEVRHRDRGEVLVLRLVERDRDIVLAACFEVVGASNDATCDVALVERTVVDHNEATVGQLCAVDDDFATVGFLVADADSCRVSFDDLTVFLVTEGGAVSVEEVDGEVRPSGLIAEVRRCGERSVSINRCFRSKDERVGVTLGLEADLDFSAGSD